MRQATKYLIAVTLFLVAYFVIRATGSEAGSQATIKVLSSIAPTIGMLPAAATMFAIYAIIRLIQSSLEFEASHAESKDTKWSWIGTVLGVIGIVYFWLGAMKAGIDR